MNAPITTSPSPAELSVRDYELTALLERILAACELPPDLRQKAQQHYAEKTEHLKKCPLLSRYEVVLKAQGSASIGTTVPPVTKKRGEFDVDLLITIEAPIRQLEPQELHREIGVYLRSEYAKDLSVMRLGWQLDYALEDRMHFDIVPAVRWIHPANGPILAAPDWEQKEWKKTNPEGYTKDFLALCERLPIFERDFIAICNSRDFSHRQEAREPRVENLPEHSPIKRPLQRVVQLTKRHRDVWFSKRPNDGLKRRPASIVVTTILWYAYERYIADHRFPSVYAVFIALAEAMTDPAILLQIEENGRKRYILSNPTLQEENLVAKWNLESSSRDVAEFFAWAEDYKKFVHTLAKAEGRHILQEQLTEGLGSEQVMPIFKADAQAVAPGSATRSNFGYVPSLGITGLAAAATALPLKPHTFHGGQ